MSNINWKVVGWIALYVFLAYAYPPLRPANIAHSLEMFAQSIQARP
jgi:hypothetical protein